MYIKIYEQKYSLRIVCNDEKIKTTQIFIKKLVTFIACINTM